MKLHTPWPAENKPFNPSLAVPTLLLKVIDGKNAARAAPISALAARSSSSACWMSGRCSNSDESSARHALADVSAAISPCRSPGTGVLS